MKRHSIRYMILILAALFIAASAVSAKVVYLNMEQFGIEASEKPLYNEAGNKTTGTVVNTTKARLGAGLTQANQGDRVEITYLGKGVVKVTNMANGSTVNIEIAENVPYK